jgi:hypothetical protein
MDKDTMALGPSGVDSALYGFDELSYLLKGVFVASPHTTEGIEERKHLFVERIHKMADELEKMVEENGEVRATILVAIERSGEGEYFPVVCVSSKGSKEMLVEACNFIYSDKRLKWAMEAVLYRELSVIERRNYI